MLAATKPTRPQDPSVARNTSHTGASGYAGSAACGKCHQDIYESFSRTRMGRSLTRATAAAIQNLPLPDSFTNETLNRHFDVFSRAGKLYESENEPDSGQGEVFRNTQQIQWIMGAGANGYSALVRRGNYLFEAPLSYYSSLKRWQLSPGYDKADNGFNRPVLAGCISCHSGHPNPADQDTGKFDPLPFSQLAVGCENCHGPGTAHIHAMSPGGSTAHGTRIVNPSRLSADLENDICMSCHEAGDSRVPRPGQTYQDFRPGKPLDDTVSILMIPMKRGDPDRSDHLDQYFEMSMSKCFRGSAGQLRCATCHDPHVEPSAEEAPEYFNAKCLGCHSRKSCTFPREARQKTMPADNCVGCHMPRREDIKVAHDSLTNHRILSKPEEPWPDEAYAQTTSSLPDLVHLNRVPGREDDLPALSLLEAYREIAEQRPEYTAAYQRALSDLEQTDPDHAPVQEGLGRRDLANGDLDDAIAHLQQAIKLDPQRGPAYSYLSEALAQTDQLNRAIDASEKAVSLNPYKAFYRKALIERLIAAKQYPKALAEMQLYMELFPEDDLMRRMLEMAKQP